jgi:hypothetical protein
MNKHRFRPCLEALEDRCLPSASSWRYNGMGHGNWDDAGMPGWPAGAAGGV